MTRVVGLDCSLPVALNDPQLGDQAIGTPHGGFVDFPSGQLREDPSSELRPVDSGNLDTTVTQPVLDGRWPGPVWDWQFHRWLPAMNPQVVSPDGSAYVYPHINGGNGPIFFTSLRIVTVSTGNDRLLYTGGEQDVPIAWTKDGIYVVDAPFEATTKGLRLINPATGAARVIESTMTWDFIAGGAAWGTGPSFYSVTGYPSHSVVRLDLTSGVMTTWYTVRDPQFLLLMAVDPAGRPIVASASGSMYWIPGREFQVVRLASPSHAQPLFTTNVPLIYEGIIWQFDSHGLWFMSGDLHGEVWFYNDNVGLHKVAEVGKDILRIAGPCR